MRRAVLIGLGLGVALAGCQDDMTRPPDPELSRGGVAAERGAVPTLMKKRTTASPLSLSVQEMNGLTPEQVAEFLVGPGVTVSNVSYTGALRAGGIFSGGAEIIGFDSGIVLSTGCITNIIGPNESPSATCINDTPGDPDLDAISGGPTFDAAVLEFDFVPTGETVFFQYVFGSEEYNEFVGSIFNDAFGFFINGVNYAEVGDPPVPITINTINRGQPGVPPTNPELFRPNDPFTPTFDAFLCPPGGCFNTEMDGVTVVLTLEAPVNPGVVNTMKLAIADVADRSWDSHVLIQAGTLAVCPNPVPLDEVFSNGGPDGQISLSSTTTTVGVFNVEPYLPLGQAPQPGWVRFGPTPEDATPADSFQLQDFTGDNNRDVRVHWSTSQLVADGRLEPGEQEITIWGVDESEGRLFCGTRLVTVVP